MLGAGTALYGRDPPTPDFLTPFTLVYGVLPLKQCLPLLTAFTRTYGTSIEGVYLTNYK